MAKARVHEIAKQYGVESKQVLAKLKQRGWFVKSASSPVPLEAELELKRCINTAAMAGADAPQWFATPAHGPPQPPRPAKTMPRPTSARVAREESEKNRRTTWTGSKFSRDDQMVWRKAGLGDFDADLAMWLLENGILPEDLRIPIRGRPAAQRFRSGEVSRHVLAIELKEARASVEQKPRALPNTREVRRDLGA